MLRCTCVKSWKIIWPLQSCLKWHEIIVLLTFLSPFSLQNQTLCKGLNELQNGQVGHMMVSLEVCIHLNKLLPPPLSLLLLYVCFFTLRLIFVLWGETSENKMLRPHFTDKAAAGGADFMDDADVSAVVGLKLQTSVVQCNWAVWSVMRVRGSPGWCPNFLWSLLIFADFSCHWLKATGAETWP